MRQAVVILLVILAIRTKELSCSLQATRSKSIDETSFAHKITKQLRTKSRIVSNDKQQQGKEAWQINFACKDKVQNRDVSEKFSCSPEYNKLKFVFIQNKKVSSIFIDLQPSLISFNKFVGLDLNNVVVKAKKDSCEIWIESSSIFKALVALLLTWLL